MIHFGSKFRVIEERWMITTDWDGNILSDKLVETSEYRAEQLARRKENGDVIVCLKLLGDGL